MTIQQCYQALCGDYQQAVRRLMRDALVARFALKFLDDHSYQELADALAQGDTECAFRAAHTLKGVALNLSFTKLAASTSQITELLRAGDLAGARCCFPAVTADYDLTVQALRRFRQDG